MKFHLIVPFLAAAALSSPLPADPDTEAPAPVDANENTIDDADLSLLYMNLAGLLEAGTLYFCYQAFKDWKEGLRSKAVGDYVMLRDGHIEPAAVAASNGTPVEIRIPIEIERTGGKDGIVIVVDPYEGN